MLSPGQIAPPIRHVVRRSDNVRVVLAEVTGFDLDARVVHASAPADLRPIELPYDSLIVAAGASQSYFGHDEFALHAPGMKTIDDALELRRRVLRRLRDGRDGDRPGRARPMADHRRRRRRSDGCRARRAGARAGDAFAAWRVPQRRSDRRPRAAARWRQRATGNLRRSALGQGDQGARAARRRAPHGFPGRRRRRQRRRRPRQGRRPHPHRRLHHGVGRRSSSVTVGRQARRGERRDARPGRAHRRRRRPHDPRTPRGVRDRRHGDGARPAGRGRGGDAGWSARRQHDRPPAQGRRRVALQVPGHGQRGDHRALPRHRQRAQVAPQRVPRLGGVVLRPPRLPDRVRQSPADDVCAGCAR